MLKSGQGTGYDLMVITNGFELVDLMVRDWLVPLDQSRMPNFYTYASDLVKDPSYDRGQRLHHGVAVRASPASATTRKLVGKEITSWSDLLDPKLSGKVGMFADNQDLPCSALCAIGVNPENSTEADWQEGRRLADQAAPAGAQVLRPVLHRRAGPR